MSRSFFTSPAVSKKLIIANAGSIELEINANKLTLQANENMNTNFSLTFPVDAGQDGYILQTNGGGELSWVENVNVAGGNNGQLQYNNDGELAGLLNFHYRDNHFLIGDDDSNTRLYFRSMQTDTYINSADYGELTIRANNVINLISRDEINGAGSIIMDTLGQILVYPDGGYELETNGNILNTAGGTNQLFSSNYSNSAILLTADSGGIKFDCKTLLQNIDRITVGASGEINSNVATGTLLNPSAPIVYLTPFPDDIADTYYWDLTGFGVQGQYLTIFYDKSTSPNNVYTRVEFGQDGLVSGSGNVSALLFQTHGDSAHLMCIPNFYGFKQWYIINTGAIVIP